MEAVRPSSGYSLMMMMHDDVTDVRSTSKDVCWVRYRCKLETITALIISNSAAPLGRDLKLRGAGGNFVSDLLVC